MCKKGKKHPAVVANGFKATDSEFWPYNTDIAGYPANSL